MTPVIFIPAWIFTIAGDYFLTVTKTHLTIGIALFCVVQLMYSLYLRTSGKMWAIRVVMMVVFVAALAVMKMFNFQNVLAMLDITLLSTNAVCAWMKNKKIGQMLTFALGLTLFTGCDICVGLRSILPASTSTLMLVMIWAFYAPSQILILIYGIREMIKKIRRL